MPSPAEIILRLILAAILGGIVGLERERRHQPAGFRTHMILCLGSTLAMMVSIHVAHTAYVNGPPYPDPARIAAQVVSGIGFLGAGAILRLGVSVKGLTTATSLWTMAGIGLAIGSGFYFGGSIATVIIVIALSAMSRVEKDLFGSKGNKILIFTAEDRPNLIPKVEEILRKHKIHINTLKINRTPQGLLNIHIEMRLLEERQISHFSDELLFLGGISELEIR